MEPCKAHGEHAHEHRPGCGHPAVQHVDHADYLHDGHMHCAHKGHVDEHQIAIAPRFPDACTPSHNCVSHLTEHVHDAECGHPPIVHGSHTDFWVAGHLHHAHGAHCDDHGALVQV